MSHSERSGANVSTTTLWARLRGYYAPGGQQVRFFVNGASIGEATADSNGLATLDTPLSSGFSQFRAQDTVTGASSFTSVAINVATPPGDFVDTLPLAVNLAQETKDSVVAELKKSKLGAQIAEAYLDKVDWDLVATLPPQELGSTIWNKQKNDTKSRPLIKVLNSNNVVQDAITLAHELRHAQDQLAIRADLEALVAKVEDFAFDVGLTFPADLMITTASESVSNAAFGANVTGGETAFIQFYADNIERPAYDQELAVAQELKAAGEDLTGVKVLFLGIPADLRNALIIQHVQPEATALRTATLDIYSKSDDFIQKTKAQDYLKAQGLAGTALTDKTKKLLLLLSMRPNLIPAKPKG